jgi:hypothetical protein
MPKFYGCDQLTELLRRYGAQGKSYSAEEVLIAQTSNTIQRFLSDPRFEKTTWTGAPEGLKEPNYRGQPLSKYLRNNESPGTNQLTLDQMLTLKEVMTGGEPQVVTFQLPISYDVVTNGLPELGLSMDWNLLDEHGRKYTNNIFISVFHIKLPDSGRSQALKQGQCRIGE